MNKFFGFVAKAFEKVPGWYFLIATIMVAAPSLWYVLSTANFERHNQSKIEVHVASYASLRVTSSSIELIDEFMRKYKGGAEYLTILQFDFAKNTRTPIYRSFNSKETEKIVMDRLKGGDGALPIFLEDDNSNNNQMIKLIQGEYFCEPFKAGGLSRVWPDLSTVFVTSCRVPIPPGFGGARGYIVVHFKEPALRDYQTDAVRVDLMKLALELEKSSPKTQSFFK